MARPPFISATRTSAQGEHSIPERRKQRIVGDIRSRLNMDLEHVLSGLRWTQKVQSTLQVHQESWRLNPITRELPLIYLRRDIDTLSLYDLKIRSNLSFHGRCLLSSEGSLIQRLRTPRQRQQSRHCSCYTQ